jgi:transposase
MNFDLDSVLNLSNVSVVGHTEEMDYRILDLEIMSIGIECPHCHNHTEKVHQNRPIIVRDLSICGSSVYLRVPRRQFYCQNCQKSSTESLSWLEKKQRQTIRYQEYIYKRVTELTVKQVSESEDIGEETVQYIFQKLARLKKKTGECLKS